MKNRRLQVVRGDKHLPRNGGDNDDHRQPCDRSTLADRRQRRLERINSHVHNGECGAAASRENALARTHTHTRRRTHIHTHARSLARRCTIIRAARAHTHGYTSARERRNASGYITDARAHAHTRSWTRTRTRRLELIKATNTHAHRSLQRTTGGRRRSVDYDGPTDWRQTNVEFGECGTGGGVRRLRCRYLHGEIVNRRFGGGSPPPGPVLPPGGRDNDRARARRQGIALGRPTSDGPRRGARRRNGTRKGTADARPRTRRRPSSRHAGNRRHNARRLNRGVGERAACVYGDQCLQSFFRKRTKSFPVSDLEKELVLVPHKEHYSFLNNFQIVSI